MKNSIEDMLTEVDRRLESIKDEKTENIVNYIEVNPEAKADFFEYLVYEHYNSMDKNENHRKNRLGIYPYIPLAVAVGTTGALYATGNFSVVDLILGVFFPTLIAGSISSRLGIQKTYNQVSDMLLTEISKDSLKEKVIDFYNKYEKDSADPKNYTKQ